MKKKKNTQQDLTALKDRLTRIIGQAEELAKDELIDAELRIRAMHACTQGTAVLHRIVMELDRHREQPDSILLEELLARDALDRTH